VVETATLGVVLALRSYQDRQRDVTPDDDVIKMAATPAWAEPNAQRVIAGAGALNRQLLCGLTATVRPAVSGLEGSGGHVDEDSDVEQDRLRQFTHFIFRNRMQISQRCADLSR